MNIVRKAVLILFAAVVVTGFAACSAFFTNSLASGLARDQADLVPDVTVKNIDDLMTQAEGNSDLSLAVLDGIGDSMAGATPEEQAVLRGAAVELAVTASGVGTAVLRDSGTILETLDGGDLEDPAVKSELIAQVSSSLSGLSNLQDTSTALIAVMPSPDDTVAFDAFVENATADDLAMAAVVLLAAESDDSEGGTEAYIDGFDSESETLSPAEELAVALAVKAADKNETEGGTGTLNDLLEALNLYTPAP